MESPLMLVFKDGKYHVAEVLGAEDGPRAGSFDFNSNVRLLDQYVPITPRKLVAASPTVPLVQRNMTWYESDRDHEPTFERKYLEYPRKDSILLTEMLPVSTRVNQTMNVRRMYTGIVNEANALAFLKGAPYFLVECVEPRQSVDIKLDEREENYIESVLRSQIEEGRLIREKDMYTISRPRTSDLVKRTKEVLPLVQLLAKK